MYTKEQLDTYGKFSIKIMQVNLAAALAVFVLEIVLYLILQWQDLILQPLPIYFMRFLVLPTLCDAFIMVVGELAIRQVSPKSLLFRYVPVIQMSCMCAVIAATHYVFSVTLCLFCFPIFFTVLFGNRKMSLQIAGLNLAFLFFTLLTRYLLGHRQDNYLLTEGIVAAMIILGTGLVCQILIYCETAKNDAIEQAHKTQLEMQEQLNRDQKTGLYGSVALRNALRNAVRDRREEPLVLALIDIDDFKRVNDCYGHAAGDKVIVRLAELMLKTSDGDVFPARFGGDEFAVIFRRDVVQARTWLEDLRSRFAAQTYDTVTDCVTVSVGIAVWDGGQSAQTLFTNADAAMYASKLRGKNLVTRYVPEQPEDYQPRESARVILSEGGESREGFF
ncbi:MAG: GGDEF domain-containing protein [Oscillospiraceae bacterium]